MNNIETQFWEFTPEWEAQHVIAQQWLADVVAKEKERQKAKRRLAAQRRLVQRAIEATMEPCKIVRITKRGRVVRVV